MRALRLSASSNTKLVLMEHIVPHAVFGLAQNTLGDKVPIPPAPLLPNLGIVSLGCYVLDLAVRARLPLASE